MINSLEQKYGSIIPINYIDFSYFFIQFQIMFMGKSNVGKKTKRKIREIVTNAKKEGKVPRHSGGKTVIRDH